MLRKEESGSTPLVFMPAPHPLNLIETSLHLRGVSCDSKGDAEATPAIIPTVMIRCRGSESKIIESFDNVEKYK